MEFASRTLSPVPDISQEPLESLTNCETAAAARAIAAFDLATGPGRTHPARRRHRRRSPAPTLGAERSTDIRIECSADASLQVYGLFN